MKCTGIIGFTTVLLINALQLATSDNILFLLTCTGYSHRVVLWPLADALLSKGHNATFISPMGPTFAKGVKTEHSNLTEVIPLRLKTFIEDFLTNNFDLNFRAYGVIPPSFLVGDYVCYKACSEMYKSDEVKTWLSTNPKVDLIVSDSWPDCAYGLTEKFNAKHVLYVPVPLVMRNFESFGINPETHSVPDLDLVRDVPLSFFNRLRNALIPLFYRLTEIIFYPMYVNLFREELGVETISDVYAIRDKTSLIILNGDHITDHARSFPPFVVKVPGIHVDDALSNMRLDEEIERFIESQGGNGNKSEGFVFISFGSIAKAGRLPLDLREVFFNSIKAFPDIRFIWKWDGEQPDECPNNLFLVPWVDQQKLLAHSRILGIVTQAGRPGSQEAWYNNVPMITFPIFADQDFNAKRYESLGMSIAMEIIGLTEEKLTEAFRKLLTDPSYKSRTKQLADLSKDVPVKSTNLALWWVEFVLRHTHEELLLLKPNARHLTWYQKRELDVWGFLLLCIASSITVFIFIVQKLFCRLYLKTIPTVSIAKEKLKSL